MDVLDIQNAALMKWKDGFFKATSKIIDISFDGVLRYIECNNVELHIMTDRPYKSLSSTTLYQLKLDFFEI